MKLIEYTIKEARSHAATHAEALRNDCEQVAEFHTRGNVLYKKLTIPAVLMIIVELFGAIALGLAGLVLMVHGEGEMGGSDFLYTGVLLLGGAIVLLLYGVFNIVKLALSGGAAHKAKVIRNLSKNFDNGAGLIKDFDADLQKALESGKDLVFKIPDSKDHALLVERRKSAAVHKKNRALKKLIKSILLGVLALVGGIVLSIGVAFCLHYRADISGMLVGISYILLYTIVFKVLQHLYELYGTPLKIGATVYFCLFQVSVFLQLLGKGVYAPTGYYLGFSGFMNAYIFTYPTITLLVSTVTVLLLIIFTDMFYLKDKLDGGFEIPMIGSANVRKTPVGVHWSFISRCIVAVLFATLCGAWMAYVIQKGWSFGAIIAFLLIGGGWGGLNFWYGNDQMVSIVDERFTFWLKMCFYALYIVCTVSLLPTFGLGTIVIFALQYFAIWAILLIFSMF